MVDHWQCLHLNHSHLCHLPHLCNHITCIRQAATLLDYSTLQVLEAFKNTLPTRLYWALFPIEYLRQAVNMAKRILTKEKIDRQLVG